LVGSVCWEVIEIEHERRISTFGDDLLAAGANVPLFDNGLLGQYKANTSSTPLPSFES
jgi:hypothetical protein